MPFLDKPIVSPVLFGRAQEIESLERALQAVRQGKGTCVLLAGEAGVGKSRLVAETKVRATQVGFTCLQSNCFEPDRALPYAPFLELLRGYAPLEIAELAPELVKLLPELSTFLSSVNPIPALEPEQEKRRLFEVLAQFLKGVMEIGDSPLLFVVEDLHWSDDTTLEFLLFLARRIATQPMLLLLTYRHDETQPSLYHFLAELDRARLATELALSRLAPAEVEAMIRAIFELAQPVRREFLEAIYALTEGNPFFVEETLKSLVTEGEIFYSFTGWTRKPLHELNIPRTVQDAVQRRTQQLSQAARHLLTLAAVVGRRFDFDLLRELTGQPETELLALVKELMAAQLVVEESAETFAFRHALTQQAIYTHLLKRERQALHQTIAAALEVRSAGSVEIHLTELAHHFFQAGIWEKALSYSQQAGEKAQAMYAPGAAQEHFTHALEAAHHLPQATPSPKLYRARGQTRELLGDFEAARQDYNQALEIARQTHDRLVEWQSLLDLGFLWRPRDYSHAGDYFQQAIELARVIGDPASLADTLNRVGNWTMIGKQPLESLRYHQEALAIFRSLNDQHGLARTLDLLGLANTMCGDVLAGLACYEQAVNLFRQLDDRVGLASSLTGLASSGASYFYTTTVWPDRSLTLCARDGEEAIALARQIGYRAGEAYALIFASFGLGTRGEYGRALTWAHTALDVATEIEHRQWMNAACVILGALYLDLLVLPVARQYLDQAVRLAQEIGSLFSLSVASAFLASTYLGQGQVAQAEAVLDAASDLDSPMQTQPQRLIWCTRAELALAQDQSDLALSIVEQLINSATGTGRAGIIPRLWWLKGEALASLGQLLEAETTLRTAAETALAQETPPMLWRIQLSLGKLYQAQGRRDQAEASLATARSIIQKLATNVEDTTLRESFLDAANNLIAHLPALAPRRTARQTFAGLTERECQVAALVAQGKSNRLLADELVVSERTVEKHIENIMSKLGFTSRVQIAAWAIEKGLTTKPESQGESTAT